MRRRQKLEERWRPWEAGGCLLWGPAGSSAPQSPTMVGCRRPSSLLAIASFLLPLINISHASLMTRIGLRLGGKHSSVSHQVKKKREKKPQKRKLRQKKTFSRWERTAAEFPGRSRSRGRRSRRSGARRLALRFDDFVVAGGCFFVVVGGCFFVFFVEVLVVVCFVEKEQEECGMKVVSEICHCW